MAATDPLQTLPATVRTLQSGPRAFPPHVRRRPPAPGHAGSSTGKCAGFNMQQMLTLFGQPEPQSALDKFVGNGPDHTEL